MLRLLLVFFIIECFCINTSVAADTIYVTKPIQLEKIGKGFGVGYLQIDNKTFEVPYTSDNGFFNALSYPYNKFKQIYFRNSIFGSFESPSLPFLQSENAGFYVIDSCKIDHLQIFKTAGDVSIYNSQVSTLGVINNNNLRLVLNSDSSVSFITIQKCKNIAFQLAQCAFKDSAEIWIHNSTISQFDFKYDKRSGCNVFFRNDTIDNFTAYSEFDSSINGYRHENIFHFYDCHIKDGFAFFDRIPNSTFIFNNCTFDPNAYLTNMGIDKLIFRNCQRISEQIVIGFAEKNREVKLGLVNSNLTNIRFDFVPNITLVFDTTDSKDVISYAYKSLLDKFEHEGKIQSYKAVDLQYRKFKDSSIWHFLNCIWWYHGYEPSLVFLWTIGLVMAFFLLNLIWWRHMFEVYPLNDGEKASSYKKATERLRFFKIVFLYTILIFFSLRVDLNRLNFKKVGFVYFFLFQYLVGLWCLVFIVRYIIKL